MASDRYAPRAALCGWTIGGRHEGGPQGERREEPGDEGELRLELSGAVAVLGIAGDGTVRLRAASGSALPALPETAVERGPWRPLAPRVHERKQGGLGVVSPGAPVSVEIDANPFALRVLDRTRHAVAELRDLRLDPEGAAQVALRVRAGERFFGFGEKRGGLDKRGERLRMRNRDGGGEAADPLYVSIPFFAVHRPHGEGAGDCGLLLESFGPSEFDVASRRDDAIAMQTATGGLDLMIFPGPLLRDVVERFTSRVGRSPLPPLWALGHHQSRYSYANERQVRELAAEIRSRRIPTDVVHLDIDYMDGFRVFTWDPKRFADPAALTKELREQGLRVVTIVDPGVKVDPDYAVYRSGREHDAFCRRRDGGEYSLRVWPGNAALPDFNRSEVRSWWAEQHRALLETGVSGVWNDMNEPAGWGADLRLGRTMLRLREQDVSDVVQSDPSDPERVVSHESVRNLYGLQHCRATRAALESFGREHRPFLLSRSGYAGVQRYAALWTGDNSSRWSHLGESIPMLLNLSLSGVPFCGADIGGYFGHCTPELYARWIQIGALYPFARTHSARGGRRQEPWRFGARVEAIARHALQLRMRLLPYLYGLFREAEETGAPVWRPLCWEFPDDPEAASVEDQLLLGPSLLVAPVVERGARRRDLYLPPGPWFSWHDGARYVGPRRLEVDAPLERLPLFARGGSVIPTRSPVAHVGETAAEPLVLEVFPGGESRGELVEDDGETSAYRGGVVARTALRLWDRAGGRLRLEIGRREGPYRIEERLLRVGIHGCAPPDSVFLDGTPVSRNEAPPGYGVEEGCVQVRLLDRGEGAAIEIEPAP